MSAATSGEGGAGQVTVYTLAAGEYATLETLSFKVTTGGAAGVHMVRLLLTIPTVGTVARLDDLNAGAASQTNFYTYGLGLNASACTLPTGLAVTDALPWTELPPGAKIVLEAIDDTGTLIPGDTFADVLLQLSGSIAAQTEPDASPISLLPGAVAA